MATQTVNIQDDIRRADDGFESAFAHADTRALAEMYTGDSMLLPAGSDFVSGRQAIARFWQGVMDMGIRQVKLEIQETEHLGEAICEVGRYTLSGEGGQAIDRGKYLVVWKQQDGQWRIHRDIWNSSSSPEPS